MLMALVLICSILVTPDLRDCTKHNARIVMVVPELSAVRLPAPGMGRPTLRKPLWRRTSPLPIGSKLSACGTSRTDLRYRKSHKLRRLPWFTFAALPQWVVHRQALTPFLKLRRCSYRDRSSHAPSGKRNERPSALPLHEDVHTEIPFARNERPLTNHPAQHYDLGKMDRRGPRRE
jgi:hypothetical protein